MSIDSIRASRFDTSYSLRTFVIVDLNVGLMFGLLMMFNSSVAVSLFAVVLMHHKPKPGLLLQLSFKIVPSLYLILERLIEL